MNMSSNALERHAAAIRQLSNGIIGDDLYIRIATTVGNIIHNLFLFHEINFIIIIIQTVNFPMYDTHFLSTPGNTAKIRAILSNIQTAKSRPFLVGSEPTVH